MENKIIISNENIKEVMELAVELAKEGDLTDSIASRLQNIDAAEAAAGITSGIDKFDAMYDKAINGNVKDVLYDAVNEALEDKSDEEQHQMLSDVVTAFSGEPGNLSIAQLKQAIVDYIDEYAVMALENGNDFTKALSALGEDALDCVYDISLQTGSRKYFAAAIFIMREQGRLPEVAVEFGAEEIGVYTAAAIASEQVIKEAASGRYTWEKTKDLLKLIAAVAAAVILVKFIMDLTWLVVVLLLGTSSLWIFFATITAIVFSSTLGLAIAGVGLINAALDGKLINKIIEFTAPGVRVLVDFWKKIVAWVKGDVAPKAKTYWQKAKENISAKAVETEQEEHYNHVSVNNTSLA